jgi:hypothetical protein
VWLLTVAANVIHWRFRVAEQFLYCPTCGIAGAVNLAMLFAVLSAALLFLAGTFPEMPFLFLLFGYSIAIEMYSV